ncbi:MAG: Lrp/AsnC family transcriptional regulator [Candidatus Asgardarchaeia archaeon]
MAKTSNVQIEMDERLVITELQKDGRVNFGDIAKACGFSRQKVWRYVNRLEENKTILGYKAIVDNKKLGLKRFLIMISVKGTLNLLGNDNSKHDYDMLNGIVETISSLGVTINGSSITHGKYDWILDVTTDMDIEVIKEIEQNIYNKFFHIQAINDIDIIQVLMEHPL